MSEVHVARDGRMGLFCNSLLLLWAIERSALGRAG